MKKTKLLGSLIIILGLFLAQNQELLHAFNFVTVCQSPLTTFHDGNPTYDISFPPGGGTTCDTIADCPEITLPANGTVYSVKVEMELSDPASEIGTPYIWIPNSNSNTLVQMRTKDMGSGVSGSIVQTFTGGVCNFSNPSRITVIPGGDVWVANRDNSSVTRLGLVNPAVSMENYECKDNYTVGSGPRGVTFDLNGKIWAGGTGDANMYKFNPDGTVLTGPIAIGATRSYGMIGDALGFIWISNRSSIPDQVVKINSTTNTIASSTAFSDDALYGIGIDNDGDIWIGNYLGTEVAVHQVDGSNGNDITPGGLPNATICGVAVDQNNIVWAAACNISPGLVYAFRQNGVQLAGSPFTSGGTHTRGLAIDFDGNIWAVNRNALGAGSVTKMDSSGSVIATYPTGGNNPYNYSDMTGLRTVPKSLSVGGTNVPLSSTGVFAVCTDGTITCSDATPCASITTFLASCTADASGNCAVPLEIFSMQAGDYTLKNLEVVYGKLIPKTTGGLLPCGRAWDDPATAWDDTNSCDFCYIVMLLNQIMNFLIKIAGIIAVLAIIITGFLFVTSTGDPERKN
ncbi:MAG: hypothetical protein KAI72_04700, partial [Candidatus Pacebacteria bacterium]|nr:hypothetical protein [Candidatus Paceibacterota bacterium]